MARRGAGKVAGTGDEHGRADGGRDARADDAAAAASEAPAWEPEQWIDEGVLRDEASEAVGRGQDLGASGPRTSRRPRWTPADDDTGAADAEVAAMAAVAAGGQEADADDPAEELRRALGPQRAMRAAQRLREAGDAFRRERYEDARKLLRPLAEQAPGVAPVRELLGLTLYRLGRWAPARRELEAFRLLTGGVEQHPVLADTYRALNRHTEVEDLWDELRAASPSAELVAEGRIVAAGSLADRGRLEDAIELLRLGIRPTKRTRPHHLRIAYALGDLYERAGDLPRARELFQRVATSDPDFVDIRARLRSLG